MSPARFSLDGDWTVCPRPLEERSESGLAALAAAPAADWLPARVPGEVHLDLVRAGLMPEPTDGAHMPECRWPETRSWWFRRVFVAPAGLLGHERLALVCEGLDLHAQVFLNQRLLGESQNAFVPAEFSLPAGLLRPEANELVIRLTAGAELALAELPWGPPGGIVGDLSLPSRWLLAGPLPEPSPDECFAALRIAPDHSTLQLGPRTLPARELVLGPDHSLNLAPLLGLREGLAACLCAELESPGDTTLTVAASADWWMKWWLNGEPVCDTTALGNGGPVVLGDRFFNLRLRAGKNLLVVKLLGGSNGFRLLAAAAPELRALGRERVIPNPASHDSVAGHRMWPAGVRRLRKPQFTYGWDWVDALPNIGVWRGVRLEARFHARLHDLRVDTRLSPGPRVSLEFSAVVENLHPWSERAAVLVLELFDPDERLVVSRRHPLSLLPGRQSLEDLLEVPRPRLWWPNGYGAQPLYRVAATLLGSADEPCDSRSFQIGLRTLALDRSPLPEGSRFRLLVNGRPVFCRGGNVGAHDAIVARVSPEKNQVLVSDARAAGFTMLRLNGCWIYEDASFFEACDRSGILVWQDFLFSYNHYPDESPAFVEAVRAEVEAIIPRLRHHPSLALWCGSNEMAWGHASWWNTDPARPAELGGVHLTQRLLPELCRLLDPRRPYWVSSPAGGEHPNSETHGDCHWWSAAMSPAMADRITHEIYDTCRARFVSEYGTHGPCHPDSIREFLPTEADRDPASLAARRHVNTFERGTVSAGIAHHYLDAPERLAWQDYSRLGQLFQATLHGGAMEALRFRKDDPRDDCAGALVWSYSDAWGETGWSVLDYYLRRKAAYHALRRACAPAKIIARRRADTLVVRLVNDTRRRFTGSATIGWWRLDGRAVHTRELPVAAPANSALTLHVEPGLAPPRGETREWIFAAVLRDARGLAVDHSHWQSAPFRRLAVPPPRFTVLRLADDLLEFHAEVYCHGVRTEDHGRAALSDNWFDLLPRVPRRVRVPSGWPADSAAWTAHHPAP